MDKPRYMGGRVKGIHLAVLAFILSLFLLLITVGGGAYVLTHETQTQATFSRELREGLIENCEKNGNPLREVVQKLLHEQIRNAESPQIRVFLPQIPLYLLRAHIAADRKRLGEIAPVVCTRQYPSP